MTPLLVALLWLAPAAPLHQTPPGPGDVAIVVRIQVHGNHSTPDAEVLRLAGLSAGRAFSEALLSTTQTRLEASGRFRDVQVLKRWSALDDPSRVVVVVIVEEQPGASIAVPDPGPVRRLSSRLMWGPLLEFEDGYGLTYGARVSVVDVLGTRTRLSAPLAWGARRQASLEWERRFARGPLTRVLAATGFHQREDPASHLDDRRRTVRLRAERALTPAWRLGVEAWSDSVRFGTVHDRIRGLAVDATVDTRLDPTFPRHAVYAMAAWEHLSFDRSHDTTRLKADLRGYLGLIGHSVLVVRTEYRRATNVLPPYERELLGGSSLRGRALGYRTGDTLAAGSLEVRAPVTSPLRLARLGVAVFADTGTAYDAGVPARHASFDTSIGAGVFLGATAFHLRADVARPLGGTPRIVVTAGTRF